jgi:Histidine kinase-, DNA gyrase B-, and HSP90-like ATPase
MSQPTQKREAGLLNATPEKRMYWSIISDYDIKTGICELVDNAIDIWMREEAQRDLLVELTLDAERQLIQIKDNAGGVKEENLRLLVAPGASLNSPDAETIGIFGVGSKRAVVALAETVTIRTRHWRDKSFQIDIGKEWLESEDWQIPHFEIPAVAKGATIVDLSALRKTFDELLVKDLITHFGQTYAWFLKKGNFEVRVNGVSVTPVDFDAWAFPRGFEPRRAILRVNLKEDGAVNIEVTAGLIRDRDPVRENYGVYFYCNHRLIVKERKSRDVGYFITSEAGVPHPDASLCRAIVRINGGAQLMPWNSTKSDINVNHPVFQAIRPTLIQLVSHFSSLSRRLKDDWQGKVFRFEKGSIENIDPIDPQQRGRLLLPSLPRVNKPQVEVLKTKNKKQIRDLPWTLGLVEAIVAVEIIGRQKLETKNRIALILLDSNFEIALKEFIVHRADLFPPSQVSIQQLFDKRHKVVAAVSQKVQIPQALLDKAKHYYELRNKLIHERATVSITDTDVDNYRETIERILATLFGLKF